MGQDDCLFSTDMQLTNANWGAEISWNVVDFDGPILIEGSDYDNEEAYIASVCQDSTCYVLTMYDSFGDGRSGASLSFNLPELGLMLVEFSLESGNTSSRQLGDSSCANRLRNLLVGRVNLQGWSGLFLY
ncbi:MAG: hypothetical protein OSA78_09470 [Flavobacteriales bacterium]|nr:hypothetical protein [Flavobacteriales bacterium]